MSPTLALFPRAVTYLLNVVVAQGTAVLKLLARENQALLVRWDSLLILDLALHIVDRVARLNLEGYSLAREGFDEAAEVLVSDRRRLFGYWCALADIHLHCKVLSASIDAFRWQGAGCTYWLRSPVWYAVVVVVDEVDDVPYRIFEGGVRHAKSSSA